ncbi:MAG: LysM peptidoglycan-binding domain-containing protein [Gammaproteobacteria bacterium]|nr:LysM peptidoglycan-binding domain-containing protein [Gammaproteobacteria bacterium]
MSLPACCRLAGALALAVLLAGCQPWLQEDGPVGPDSTDAEPAESLAEIIVHPPLPREPVRRPSAPRTQAPDTPPETPEPPPDLLARMVAGFALEPVDNARVRQELAWFTRNPAYIDRVFTRGSLFLPHILDQIEARGLPSELALIPLIESAYDPFAYSHGRAAGLWQFIPGTGQRFGLRQNWWYDGRRDVVESTRAALEYFEYLNGFFDGDWLLAMAAYNAGEGRVRQAVNRNLRADRNPAFWYLQLPRETRHYVPRLLAIRKLLSDPEAHGITLPELPDEPGFAIVPVEGQIDLALAAELAEISTDEIYRLNAGFNRWATDPEGPQRLLVPADRELDFRERLAAIDLREQVQWSRHRVANGETLIHIARRYGTTVEVIRDVNEINGNMIRAGQYLMIPQAVRSLEHYTGSADMRLAATQSRPRGNTRSTHTVVSGESLWTIARRHGVGVRELAAWNGMAPGDTLTIGRQLVIWQDGRNARSSAASTPAATLAQAAPSEAARLRRVNYTVRQGDSLWRIANRFAVSVDELLEWNALSREAVLRPGQRLVLHVDVTRQSG